MKVCMSTPIPGTGITAILEVLFLEFSRSVHQLDAFTTQRSFEQAGSEDCYLSLQMHWSFLY